VSLSSVGSSTTGTGSDFYMDLLLAQLQNQDPMEPLSNSEMVTQLAQLSNVDALEKMTASFSEILKFQQLLSGTELLGRSLEYSANGQTGSGVVEAVTASDGAIKLVVGGTQVALDNIERIL